MPVGGTLRGVRACARGLAVLTGLLLAVVTLAGPARAAATNGAVAFELGNSRHISHIPAELISASRVDDPGWTLAQGKAAVRSGVISRVPGAPAVVDTDAIMAAVKGTAIRVLMLPFAPLATKGRDAAGSRAVDLKDWASDQGIDLIEVEGLQVVFDIYDVVPTSMAELQPVLSGMDVTGQVRAAIAHLRDRPEPPDATLRPERPADPGQVDTIADALAAHRIYNDPTLADEQQVLDGWTDAGENLTVRAAFLPPAPRGAELTDLAAALHRRFPDDLVVVARGRWLDVAGPDPTLLHSALLWVYGYYSRPVLGWQVDPAVLVSLLAERVGLLRTGTATDQPSPDQPSDPVSSVSHALPWIFGGAALAIVTVVTLVRAFGGRRQRARRISADRRATTERRELGARLAELAGQVAAIDPLVHGRAARHDYSSALERYRVASDVLGSDGSVPVARGALDAAEEHLKLVAAEVGVPPARPGGETADGMVDPGTSGPSPSGGAER